MALDEQFHYKSRQMRQLIISNLKLVGSSSITNLVVSCLAAANALRSNLGIDVELHANLSY